ncbi:Short-chain dehydrogenase [Geosmithia morbida]|uniref:Short-chain dehydrogenase n=1 Tax=Geosmithia morbida TaxID=1094350 RepID=A0A9P4YXI7_9HYPO|nr:Short-chain dehydrogenase [Geosmithia morbida]KAF4123508.1 Short-chain dehydrogenase [Geosmithia morbida]
MSDTPVALITAGSAGLGAATARLFARNGMRVAVNYYSNAERANRLAEELATISPDTLGKLDYVAIRADLGDRAQLTQLVDETVRTFGRIDVVFSNGGWTRFRDIGNLDDNVVEEDWDRCFNMNVKSHLFLMHAAKKHLDVTKGAFITTASLAGVSVSGSSLAYSVTKAAQIHLAKGLANAAGPNIRVNTVSPGLMLTDWGLEVFSVEKQNAIRERTRLKRLVEVDDVAEQVLCLAKSKSTTGVNVVIDGGMFA